jgi:hypothetical protein
MEFFLKRSPKPITERSWFSWVLLSAFYLINLWDKNTRVVDICFAVVLAFILLINLINWLRSRFIGLKDKVIIDEFAVQIFGTEIHSPDNEMIQVAEIQKVTNYKEALLVFYRKNGLEKCSRFMKQWFQPGDWEKFCDAVQSLKSPEATAR